MPNIKVSIPTHYAFGRFSDGRLSSEVRTVRREFTLEEANERCILVHLGCTNESAHACGSWCRSTVVQVDPSGMYTRKQAATASSRSRQNSEKLWLQFLNS